MLLRYGILTFFVMNCLACARPYTIEHNYGMRNLLYQEVKASYYGDYKAQAWRKLRPAVSRSAIKKAFPQSNVIYKAHTEMEPFITSIWLEHENDSLKAAANWKRLALVTEEPLPNFPGSIHQSYLWARDQDTLWVQDYAIPTEEHTYRLLFFSTGPWKSNLRREANKLALNFRYQTSPEDILLQAENAYKQKDYEASAQLYRKGIQQKQQVESGTYYDAACSWALLDSSAQAVAYLDSAVANGWINVQWMSNDPDLRSLQGREDFQAALSGAKANYEIFIQNQGYNVPLLKKLEALYIRDQALRQLLADATERFGADSEQMQYFYKLMVQEDSAVLAELLPLLEKQDWPGRSEVGNRANAAVYLIIQHAPLDIQERYLPALRASVEEGESLARHLAYLEDRVRVRKDQKQLYGSQLRRNPQTGKSELYPIEAPEYINQRRAAIGLGPIEEYAKRYGIEWTIPQKTK